MISLTGKWRKMPEAAKASLMFAVSSFLVKGISFLTTPVFTRIMTKEQLGTVTVYNSWASILEVFALLGMTSAGVFNVGLKDHRQDRRPFISSVMLLCNAVTVVVFAVLFALKGLLGESFLLPGGLLLIMLIQFLFQPAQIFWITAQRYEYKWKAAFIITVLSSLLSQGLSVIALLNFTAYPAADMKIWTMNLGLLAVEIPIYILILARGKKGFDGRLWKETLLFALPLVPHYLAQHVLNSSDKIMIESLYSQEGAAVYSVAMNISMVATVLWNAVNASLVPFTFEAIEKKEGSRVNGVVLPVLAVYGALCVLVCLIAPEIMWILGGDAYMEGIRAVPPIAVNAFLCALYNIYANIEFYYKKSLWITLSTVVAALANILLNLWLIPSAGYVGAAYTTLLSHLLLVAMHYIGCKRCHKEKLYNDKAIFLILGLCMAGSAGSMLLYSNDLLRYITLGAAALALALNGRRLIALVRRIKDRL